MRDEFWSILKSQPGVGILIIDVDGVVRYCNKQARTIYHGNDFDPTGLTIEEVEGSEFAAERMPAVRSVIETGRPMLIRHIRGGRYTEAMIWPMEAVENQKPRVISVTRQSLEPSPETEDRQVLDSKLIDLGPLDVLTRRELEVLSMIGHGVPQKTVASQLGVTQRTIERYRTDIARKLRISSIAEAARIVQVAGLDADDARLPRLHRWREDASGPATP